MHTPRIVAVVMWFLITPAFEYCQTPNICRDACAPCIFNLKTIGNTSRTSPEERVEQLATIFGSGYAKVACKGDGLASWDLQPVFSS